MCPYTQAEILFLLIYGQCSSHCFRAFFAIKAAMTFSLPVKSILIFPRLSQFYSLRGQLVFSDKTSVIVFSQWNYFIFRFQYYDMEIYQLSGYNSIVRVCVNAHCTVCETAVHIHKFLMQRGLIIRHAHYINVTVEVLFTSQMFCGVSSWVYPHVPQHYQRNCPLWRCSFIDSLFLFSVRFQLTFAARIKF